MASLMQAPQVPRSVDSLRSMWAACEQLYLTDPMQAANAGEELMRLDAERYRSVDVLGWRGHDHPLDHHAR